MVENNLGANVTVEMKKSFQGVTIKYGTTQSCGCLHRDYIKNKLSENLVGKRFGKLVVIERTDSKYDKTHWLCKCDCGNETVVSSSGLKSGHAQSCGCYQDEVASDTYFIDLSGRVLSTFLRIFW